MWCVGQLDDDYIACMEDVLETYERPYDPTEPVVCLDEKPVTLHADVRPPTPAAPGREARRDSEYERCGTANVFCAVEPKAGRHFTFATPDRSGVEFAKALFELAMAYPEAETIHLVMDNLSTHSRKSLTDLCGEEFGAEDLGRLHAALHAGAWQLVESGGDRDRTVLAAMFGQQTHLRLGDFTPSGRRLEPPRQPRAGEDRLEVRPPSGASYVPLLKTIYQAVRELVRNSWGKSWADNGHAWITKDYLANRLLGVAVPSN